MSITNIVILSHGSVPAGMPAVPGENRWWIWDSLPGLVSTKRLTSVHGIRWSSPDNGKWPVLTPAGRSQERGDGCERKTSTHHRGTVMVSCKPIDHLRYRHRSGTNGNSHGMARTAPDMVYRLHSSRRTMDAVHSKAAVKAETGGLSLGTQRATGCVALGLPRNAW